MKIFNSFILIAVGAVVLVAGYLVFANNRAQAEEMEIHVWNEGQAEMFVCDTTTFQKLLDDNEKSRMCVVKAVVQSEPARLPVVRKMLGYDTVRTKIMDKIAADPALRAQMEQKLAATAKK